MFSPVRKYSLVFFHLTVDGWLLALKENLGRFMGEHSISNTVEGMCEVKGWVMFQENHSHVPSFPNGMDSYAQDNLTLVMVQAKWAIA